MKHHILFLSIFLISCNPDKQTAEEIKQPITMEESESLDVDSVHLNEEDSRNIERTNDEESEVVYNDCIFDNDYKRLTSEWLDDLSISNYIWKDELNRALIPSVEDTIYISKGGCDHFGYVVELRIYNDNFSSTDSLSIISKANEIATKYGMDHYSKMIQDSRLTKIENKGSSTWYEIPDNNLNDNVYYNGIEFRIDGAAKIISISKYIN